MSHRRRTRSLLVIIGVLVSCGVAPAQDETLELRLRLKQGAVYRLKTTVEQRINHTSGANQQATATEQAFSVAYSMSVGSVDAAGNMKVATKYDSVQFRQKGPAGAVEYDSANPPKQVPPPARAFAALVGLGFDVTLTPRGDVTAIDGLEPMFDEMVHKLDLPAGPQRDAVRKALAEQFGAEAMKQSLQNMFSLYPEKPVAVGESWQRKLVIGRGFPAVIDATYTLKGRKDGVASVEIKASVSPNDAAGPVELGTGRMSYELKGEQSGTADVDEATGWTRRLATTQLLGGTLRFQGGGGVPEAATPVTVHEKVTMEAVK